MNTIQDAELLDNLGQFELAYSYTPLSTYIWCCELHTMLASMGVPNWSVVSEKEEQKRCGRVCSRGLSCVCLSYVLRCI